MQELHQLGQKDGHSDEASAPRVKGSPLFAPAGTASPAGRSTDSAQFAQVAQQASGRRVEAFSVGVGFSDGQVELDFGWGQGGYTSK